eukprot:CAMPEP_0194375052 /NCGR_PEP_ID=MMETSP0174-20130528/23508_1 /TAXON_ID=216777 /ORGANISM="Proboscia alata, Strain PI-D3" /LENGTH=558 /DNA_ID=CAMNT_0039154987 /DNA_START=44 /DNA_END=1717 /DNA_ORIENTATION=+
MNEKEEESQPNPPRPPTSAFPPPQQQQQNTNDSNNDNKYILSIDMDNVDNFEIDEHIEMDSGTDDKGNTIVETAQKLGSNLPSPEYKSFIDDTSYAPQGSIVINDDDGNHHSLPEYESFMAERGRRIVRHDKRRHFELTIELALAMIIVILFGIVVSEFESVGSKSNDSNISSGNILNDDDSKNNRSNEIPFPPSNLNQFCSGDSILTNTGYARCSRNCNGSQCCFDPKNDPRSCYKANKEQCDLYSICHVLSQADMSGKLSPDSDEQSSNSSTNNFDDMKIAAKVSTVTPTYSPAVWTHVDDDYRTDYSDADDGDDYNEPLNDNETFDTNSLYTDDDTSGDKIDKNASDGTYTVDDGGNYNDNGDDKNIKEDKDQFNDYDKTSQEEFNDDDDKETINELIKYEEAIKNQAVYNDIDNNLNDDNYEDENILQQLGDDDDDNKEELIKYEESITNQGMNNDVGNTLNQSDNENDEIQKQLDDDNDGDVKDELIKYEESVKKQAAYNNVDKNLNDDNGENDDTQNQLDDMYDDDDDIRNRQGNNDKNMNKNSNNINDDNW